MMEFLSIFVYCGQSIKDAAGANLLFSYCILVRFLCTTLKVLSRYSQILCNLIENFLRLFSDLEKGARYSTTKIVSSRCVFKRGSQSRQTLSRISDEVNRTGNSSCEFHGKKYYRKRLAITIQR